MQEATWAKWSYEKMLGQPKEKYGLWEGNEKKKKRKKEGGLNQRHTEGRADLNKEGFVLLWGEKNRVGW